MNYTICFLNVLRLYPSLRQARAHCGMVTTAVAARHESKGCPTVYQVYLGGIEARIANALFFLFPPDKFKWPPNNILQGGNPSKGY